MTTIFNRKKNEGQSTNSVMDMQSSSQDDTSESTSKSKENLLKPSIIMKGLSDIAQNFDNFAPVISKICKLGEQVIELYEKAQHNKKLCGLLLKRCNCAVASVKDLDIRRTEYKEFFFKKGNLELLIAFSKCIEKSKEFISRVSKIHKLMKYLLAGSIEDDLKELVNEFDGYMLSLNFSFTIQTRDDSIIIKDYVIQIHELLSNVYNIPNDKQKQQNFYSEVDLVIREHRKFLIQNEKPNSDELITIVEENEPLLNGNDYQKTDHHSSEKIEKRISFKDSTDVSFKEFSNISSSNNVDTQIEILHHDIRSANILVNKDRKVRIANFGLSRKFSDATRSVAQDSENVRYMAPEKLLLSKNEKRKYDSKCEIYRKRIQDKHYEPFSDDVPLDWQLTVSKAIDYEPRWRPNMSDICRDFYKLSENYSKSKPSLINISILPVNDAIKEHKLNNGDKQLAWNSFKFYSIINAEAKYWVGYYLFHHAALAALLGEVWRQYSISRVSTYLINATNAVDITVQSVFIYSAKVNQAFRPVISTTSIASVAFVR
ncbi:9613_t:CDS:2 [Rhizophagus irregularis]|nr:9613_t:CDS:2 [Rhizophagus irregularis]